ncbi:2-amino-4-hydroxy-6-hydroxymethyldihydropteridine diphosphokinase [Aquimarina agarivorans]|uniref:2-amino-4-hydroxy-6- hydroxymethyldihydropteridine diphosphokinase n=1 Tax=Aquimarina agarivorans TaxID=980584 RepID=UPI000248E81A|nr:2-amino-4-hydroxy-6-hydroxymethyldihydropteridine diphosphokinase [Aquimarina agarivorans]
MKTKKTITELLISLGSNIEPRDFYLQQAVSLIKQHLGKVVNYSSVYQTPAWGFVSTTFLNACVTIQTDKDTKSALNILQHIEIDLGRKQKEGAAYEARPIDLDIIYSSEGIFCYRKLTVPHPLMQQRKFVLIPMLDIAAHQRHPLLHKTTQELLKNCTDSSEIRLTKYQLT